MMRAVLLENPGADARCRVEGIPVPALQKGQVLIKAAYAGINRADLLQSQGRYPLPGGNQSVPGMELSGTIVECGEGVTDFKVGHPACALVSEGAFAEYAAVDARHVLPVPAGMTLEQAAALPEACFTVWVSFVWQAELKAGETILIHGGTSGIGTIGIQIAKLLGARVFTTCGSPEKCALAERLGADHAIPYRDEDFVAAVKTLTGGKGVDAILDMVGGDYVERNLQALALGGRLAIIAFQKSAKVQANLGPLLTKRLKVMGSTLRARPAAEKAQLAEELRRRVWPALDAGTIKPVIDRIFLLEEAQKALERMDQGLNIGKILLKL